MRKFSSLPQIKVKGVPVLNKKMEFEIEVDRKIDLTFQRACEFLEHDTFEGERQVNENHVQTLFKAHCNGEFIWEHVEIGVALVATMPDKRFRVNGQHTSWLRVNLGEKYSEKCIVREVVYKVPDETNLRRLYSTFDQNKTRTQGHTFRVLISGSRMAADLPMSQVNKLAAGFKLFMFEQGTPDFQRVNSGDLAALALNKHASLFSTVGIFRRPGNIALYIPGQRAAVIGAMFATFNVSVQAASEFWTPIFTGLGLNVKTDARYQLKRFLETHSHSEGGNVVSAEELFRVCISAWNHWRKNNPVSRLTSTDKRQKAI